MEIRQAARVLEITQAGLIVEWIGFEGQETIPLEKLQKNFNINDRFVATVSRNDDWQLIEILEVEILPPLTEEKKQEFWRRLDAKRLSN